MSGSGSRKASVLPEPDWNGHHHLRSPPLLATIYPNDTAWWDVDNHPWLILGCEKS